MNSAISKPALADSPLRAQVHPSAVKGLSLTAILVTLKLTYGLVPIVAGLDKFTNLLVDWQMYLNPAIADILPLSGAVFLMIVGVIEIAAGVVVLARPRLGGFVVMAWLICIALSLIASGRYFDVAVRDLVMAVGAFTFANLTSLSERMTLNKISG